jgi:hypothetical protein
MNHELPLVNSNGELGALPLLSSGLTGLFLLASCFSRLLSRPCVRVALG